MEHNVFAAYIKCCKAIFDMRKIKFILSVFIASIIIILVIHYNIFGAKDKIYQSYPDIRIDLRNKALSLVAEHTKPGNLDNDYKVKFLPDTQFVKLDLEKKKLTFSENYYKKHPFHWKQNSFYIENLIDKILITNYLGEVYYSAINNFKELKLKELPLNLIHSNLLPPYRVLDTYTYNGQLFVSYIKRKNDDCQELHISYSEINFKSLNFKKFFTSEECGKWVQGGRMVFYKHKNVDGILFTTSDAKPDKVDNLPQDKNSIFGKILFIELESKNHSIFSIGHRSIQGLYVSKDLIISSEHGPRGGDEINKIIFNKNYGWPVASYGEKYSIDNPKKLSYSNDHTAYKYKEPIYSYIPAIAPSEIIKLPNSFSKIFQNNFLLSTLSSGHLHRLKFDNDFTRVIFDEKIFIGERVRDIKFIEELNAVILAFEDKGEIGILKVLEK